MKIALRSAVNPWMSGFIVLLLAGLGFKDFSDQPYILVSRVVNSIRKNLFRLWLSQFQLSRLKEVGDTFMREAGYNLRFLENFKQWVSQSTCTI